MCYRRANYVIEVGVSQSAQKLALLFLLMDGIKEKATAVGTRDGFKMLKVKCCSAQICIMCSYWQWAFCACKVRGHLSAGQLNVTL